MIDVTHGGGTPPMRKLDIDGTAAATSDARSSAHDAGQGHTSFDTRCSKLANPGVDSFGYLEKCGGELLEIR